MIRTVIKTKDRAVVALRERSPDFVFVGNASNLIGAINAVPQLGSKDEYGFIVSSVTAKRISDWGTWWDWLLGRSKPKWLVEVSYMPKLIADEATDTRSETE